MSADKETTKYSVPGLERGLRILCEFTRETPVLTAPELARRLDVPRTTVFRLLVTLESLGFVEKAANGREYQLGTAVLKLGFEYLASLSLTELGRPILDKLRDDLGYSANLVVRDGRDIIYVQKATAGSIFTSSVHIGTRLPAHATILGRALLCRHSLPALRALYPEETLQTYSAHTPTTVEALFTLLQADKARGYVVAEGFFEPHISSIAAPVLNAEGQVAAALGITIPDAKIPEARHQSLAHTVVAAAAQLSECLDYRAPGSAARQAG
ncbi:MAG TPA: IclR family transcriptional regulator [Pusillimonas sp.]|uniref:IclR family transcriptional regulator n=1 Tax=Pusillimonas sp. TaxID=3040095 RepID=UPI002D0A5708|nr:IclR family transcriptional regulator [Pusillimonas sp.]HUH88820.1 IclR family transcriptional regulator [Pusillimonas sp.]